MPIKIWAKLTFYIYLKGGDMEMEERKPTHKKWKLYKPPPKEDHSDNFKKLIIVIIISVVFIGGELAGGFISHSISVFSDAFHLITDLIGFLMSFVFIWYSRKKPTNTMTFGFHRMELLGALGNLFIIWALAFFLIYEATGRIINNDFVKEPMVMLIVACAGLPVNIAMYFVLHTGGAHSHGLMSQGCGEQFSIQEETEMCGEIMCEDIECLISNEYVEHCHKENEIHRHGDKVEVQDNKIVKKKPVRADGNDSDLVIADESDMGKMEGKPINTQKEKSDDHHHGKDCHKDHKHDHGHDHDHKGHEHKGHDHKGHDHKGHGHHGHDHHGHDHGHHHESMSMKAAVLHAISDIIQSIGLIISSTVIFFFGSDMGHTVTQYNPWHLFDPISTYIFCLIVIASTWPITKNCYQIIMESAPENIKVDDIKQEFQKIQGIVDVHDLHIWDLRPGKTILIAHVFSRNGQERNVLRSLTEISRKKRIYHSTFQVEEVDLKDNDEYILCDHDIH